VITSLQGKIAVVTGGASGIGAACVRHLAACGAKVAIADRLEEAGQALARELGANALAVAVDVADEASCRRMIEATLTRFGRLDVAVNCAGVGNKDRSRVADLSWESWRAVTSVNLDGVFLCMKAEIAAMLKSGGGSIVNIASVMGTVAVECV
jgi:NAD(P)-dependent dehydrogenase (short-subunit alcohol dehydrogenase family)